MTKPELDQARLFITSDIEREIELVRGQDLWWKKAARRLWGVRPGGGNLLAALGLLCYTEFAGRIKRNDFSGASSRACFDEFFADLGPDYASLLQSCRVYNDLRCGLAHEYFVKMSCDIAMLEGTRSAGVQWTGTKYVFVVEAYWRDFRAAFDRLAESIQTRQPNIALLPTGVTHSQHARG
jgi:hypothetical protein